MEAEDTEYLKLPLEERCIHKNWKARVNGYEECTTYFPQISISDDKCQELLKFAPLMKKFATDSNAVALDKALVAVLAFIESAHLSIAGRTAGEVTAGIVAKCLAAQKKTTQEKALDLVLMYCEIEKYEAVQEELIKGFSQKNPKVVCGCVRAITTALREFGKNVISIKLLVKSMGAILEDRDKNVRDEAKKMVIEMYRWAGIALKPQLASLKPIQIQELVAEFEKLPSGKPTPNRLLKSQQEKIAAIAVEGDEEEDVEDDDDGAEVVDAADFAVAVNLLDQLGKDFYELVEAKKWQDRKKAMETLLPLSQSMKLETGDYAEVLSALKKIIGKDTNVMIVALAAQCMMGIAKGLRNKFSIYAVSCMSTLLPKFKEKKLNVVTSLRDAADAIFQTSSIESLQEIVCESLKNKNPNVKAETASFIARSFSYCTPIILTKKILKLYVSELLKTLSESDPIVRENSAEALGTALKVVGDRVMDPFIKDLDGPKNQKIKQCAEKAEIKVKFKAPKPKPVAKSAPPSSRPVGKAKVVKPPPPSNESKKSSTSKPVNSATMVKKAAPSKSAKIIKGGGGFAPPELEECNKECEISSEEALEKAQEVLSVECVAGLIDSNWKTRLTAVEDMSQTIQCMCDIPTQALIKTIVSRPGLKDNNFQVLKVKLEVIKFLAEKSTFSRQSADICLSELVDKFGDPKNGSFVGEVLTAVSEAVQLQYVGVEVFNFAMAQKNPKIQEVTVKWLTDAIKEFGFVLKPKSLITNIKAALSHTNASIRSSAVNLCGTIFMYVGPTFRNYFDDEKASVLQQIDAEFDKMSGVSPPSPSRGKDHEKIAPIGNDDNVNEDENDQQFQNDNFDTNDASSRIDISSQITSDLISELADKNWKVRIEALSKVAAIINAAKYITTDIGELPAAICARLSDTNKNIGAEALRITSSLASALGPHCKFHTRIIVPGIFAAFGDTKQSMRQQALVALNNWVDHLGSVKDVVDGDMCIDALKSGSPLIKSELIVWLSSKLKDAPVKSLNKDELNGCVGYLFSGLEDRNADIRKSSSEAIYPFMLHLGFEAMSRHVAKVKPSSKNTVTQALEKARAMLPVRSAPPSGRGKVGPGGQSTMGSSDRATSGVSRGAATVRRGPQRAQSASKVNWKKEEDVDNSPLLQVNNLKQQRIMEEQRLKTLKWDTSCSPRPELVSQLKDQMTSANVNRILMTNMFHVNFKNHIKAIDSLAEDLNMNVDAAVMNLDLILRWLTIRFFDTNPSVILKAMDYLTNIFSILSDESCNMTDYEAYAFLPAIIMKFGDPKDSIRGSARNILKMICNIYPSGKVSSYILDGLKSKNARQRAECLETMGSLIEDFGTSVCQPSAAQALKEVARQIGDRDNSVRNAALNCLLQVYFREGEKVYKLIGHISSKDFSLLEERIKRSAKNRPIIRKQPEPDSVAVRGMAGGRINRVIPTAAAQPAPLLRDGSVPVANDNSILRRYGQRPLSADMSNINSRIQIDYEYLEQLVDDKITMTETRPNLKLEEIPDLSAILNDKPSYPITSSRYTRPGFTASVMRANIANANIGFDDASQAIDLVISQIGTPDLNTVIVALSQIDEVIQSDEKRSQLVSHVDQLLTIATLQFRLVLNTKMGDVNTGQNDCVRIYRSLTYCLMNIFTNKELGTRATKDVLHDVIHVIISILLDTRLGGHLPDGNLVIRSLNVLVVRIIEKAHFTQIFSALLKLLHESIGGGTVNSKFLELVMKCNWKGIRILHRKKDELDPVLILQDAHQFLVEYPSNSWTDKENNLPLKTIKTVVHTIVKVYGQSITTYLSKVPNVDGSEIQKYINKDLDNLRLSKSEGDDGTTDSNRTIKANQYSSDIDGATVTLVSPRRLSKAANSTLSEIFKKIGSKENNKEGIIQLYEFKKANPDADIDSFLRKSSQFFQNYIEKGLKKVECERQAESKMAISSSSDGSAAANAPLSSIQVCESSKDRGNVNVNELVDEFREIASQAGFDNNYITSAVKNIFSADKKPSDPVD